MMLVKSSCALLQPGIAAETAWAPRGTGVKGFVRVLHTAAGVRMAARTAPVDLADTLSSGSV